MYIVGSVYRPQYFGNNLLPVYSKQAGGCTVHELERENKRMLRKAAANKYGGEPTDYTVVAIYGRYDSAETAKMIVSQQKKEDLEKRKQQSAGFSP